MLLRTLPPRLVHVTQSSVVSTTSAMPRLSRAMKSTAWRQFNTTIVAAPSSLDRSGRAFDATTFSHAAWMERIVFLLEDDVMAQDMATRFHRWRTHLPSVQVYVPVACTSDPHHLDTLARLGAGFVCTSPDDIQRALGCGIPTTDIVYVDRRKPPAHVVGVDWMTFGSHDELTTMQRINPHARVVLSLRVVDDHGGALDQVPALLDHAKTICANVVGVRFHVDETGHAVEAYTSAIARARHVFDLAAALGFTFHVLDIGGGFDKPSSDWSFATTAEALNEALVTHFPSQVQIIAEPGHFFAAASHFGDEIPQR
ncbi:Aste57867_15233 [Aphanomyces stellatus]|uniref:Aste57867_15233 protein n=1 Tax=Aphanomyces stellatus TaxID=120398 RepID=A0A485L4H4_9STRA|nr:hypothetical protein As57867_015177 [Aphanomyces stellatus]VFT92042.1 Aste57867_15233 [Aphanomyces stellatus]